MFKTITSIMLAAIFMLAGISYIPSVAAAIPYLDHFMYIGAPLAVIAGLATLFAWTSTDLHDG